MSDVAGYAVAAAARLGLQVGDTVGESGYDDDVDHELRDAIADAIDAELLDDDSDEVLAAVLLWWREDDGDLTDALIDAVPLLAPGGVIWLAHAQDRAARLRRTQRDRRGDADRRNGPDDVGERRPGLDAGQAGPATLGQGAPLMVGTGLAVGAAAPDFTLPDANKSPVSLSSYRGRQPVLLVFYPFAFSRVCTGELCQLRDDLASFTERRGTGAGDLHGHLPVAAGVGGRAGIPVPAVVRLLAAR